MRINISNPSPSVARQEVDRVGFGADFESERWVLHSRSPTRLARLTSIMLMRVVRLLECGSRRGIPPQSPVVTSAGRRTRRPLLKTTVALVSDWCIVQRAFAQRFTKERSKPAR